MNQINPNLNSPDFGPTNPVYPQVVQFMRVTGATVGGNVYPCSVQQSGGNTASSRDRETAWVWEPNGTTLITDGSGYYLGRLIGSFTNGGNTYPLYETMAFPTSGGSSSIKTQETEGGTVVLTINPTNTLQFEAGVDASQGTLTNIGGGIARWTPWPLTIQDLIPTVEVRTTTITFGTNFYISEPSANNTRVDFGLTVDDLVVNTVTKVQHVTFQAGFTVTVNATTGHAFVAFSGSAYSLTVEDETSWTLTGVAITFPQPSANAGTPVSGCVTLDFLYPLYVTTPGATDATVSCLLADQTHSGYVDHGENTPIGASGALQDFNGVKRFHNAPVGGTDPNFFVEINGNTGSNLTSQIGFTSKGTYGGAAAVVNGATLGYEAVGNADGTLTTSVSNQNGNVNNFIVEAGGNRAVFADSDGLQVNRIKIQTPFYTNWKPETWLSGLCKTWSNGNGASAGFSAPDDEEYNNTWLVGGVSGTTLVQNNACTFVFAGGLFKQGYWTPPFGAPATTDPVTHLPQWNHGKWYLLGSNNPNGGAGSINWIPVDVGVPYEPGHFGGTPPPNAANISIFYGVTTIATLPLPATNFTSGAQALDYLTDLLLNAYNGSTAAPAGGVIPLAQLTPTGSQGSITVSYGLITACTLPT